MNTESIPIIDAVGIDSILRQTASPAPSRVREIIARSAEMQGLDSGMWRC